MRFTKMLILAITASIAAMALVGTSSALAVDSIVLCKENPGSTEALCPEKSLYPSGTVIKAKAANPKLSGTLTVECPESVVEGKTTAASGNPLTGEITSLTFGPNGKCSNCPTVDVESLPYKNVKVVAKTVGEKEEFFLISEGFAQLLNCFGFINCLYKTPAGGVELLIENRANGLPLIKAEAETLTGPGGVCGSSGAWTATYEVTAPDPVWIALDKPLI